VYTMYDPRSSTTPTATTMNDAPRRTVQRIESAPRYGRNASGTVTVPSGC